MNNWIKIKNYCLTNIKGILFVLGLILFSFMFYKLCVQKPENTNTTINIIINGCCDGNNNPDPPAHSKKATGCPLDEKLNIFLTLTISLSYAGFVLYKRENEKY